MAVSTKLHSLNAYPEWQEDKLWKQVRSFVKSIQINPQKAAYPKTMTDTQIRKRFHQKFHKDYEVVNNRLYYRPKDANGNYRLSLEIIEPVGDKVKNAIKRIYDSDVKSGWGQTMFFWKICQEYLGITRQMTTEFLKNQETYQLTRPYVKRVNNPIQTKCPNAKWMVDCVFVLQYGFDPYAEGKKAEAKNVYDVNTEYEHRQLDEELAGMASYLYIFTCVDAYSRKVWAEPMLSHSAEETTIALKKVMRDSGTIPKVIVTDNGGEFAGEFQELLNANNIFHIKTTSYSPWGNGIVERMNRSLREKIKQGFVRHGNKKGSLEWVKYLATYCDNINNSRSTKLNVTPNMLWSPGYHQPPHNYEPNWNVDEVADHSRLKVIRENYQNNRIHLAREQLTKQPANIFDKGDWVRIALEQFDQGESRKRRKNKMETKYNAINWSPEIFEITHIIGGKPAPNQNLQQMGIKAWDIREQKYVVKHLEPPQTVLKKQFFGSELMLVPKTSRFTEISNPRARQLNRFVIEYEN